MNNKLNPAGYLRLVIYVLSEIGRASCRERV